jgi:hypothetical protein
MAQHIEYQKSESIPNEDDPLIAVVIVKHTRRGDDDEAVGVDVDTTSFA